PSFTLADYAAEVAKQSGKAIKYHNLPAAEYAKVLEDHAGFPAPLAQMFADIDQEIAHGELETTDNTLSELLDGDVHSL
ncbi:MAG TPA: hypothetical protein PLR74_15515, partial [Agriterribacter sp.]|nr:hypothetical protein [Agriterribacter sp.]